jgi:hypothetical protein
MVTVRIEAMMATRPIQASQLILPRVRMLHSPKAAMAATATKTAVHAAWVLTALRPMEIPSSPEPPTKMSSRQNAKAMTSRPQRPNMRCPASSSE